MMTKRRIAAVGAVVVKLLIGIGVRELIRGSWRNGWPMLAKLRGSDGKIVDG